MKSVAGVIAVAVLLSEASFASPVGIPESASILFQGPVSVTSDSVHNIHVEISEAFEGHVRIVHGQCDMIDIEQHHHEIGSTYVRREARPDRFVWTVPEDAIHQGCLHGYSGGKLIGRSAPVNIVEPLHKRQTISEVADMSGPWFDGVAALAAKETTEVFSEEAKSKSIAIVGGGMSGLLTSLLLDSAGLHNWHITEASGRLGGRVRTRYLAGSAPDEYQYQEMGYFHCCVHSGSHTDSLQAHALPSISLIC